jgi:hypothetical protein
LYIKRTIAGLIGLVAWCTILSPCAARAQAPLVPRMLSTPTPLPATPPDWLTPACKDWWVAWRKHNVGVTAEEERRSEACTWKTLGCADFYPQWTKRELPDTPQNEARAGACLSISPFDAWGCPQLVQRLKERGPDVPMTPEEHSYFHVCAEMNPRNRQTFTGPPLGGWSHGKGHVTRVPGPRAPLSQPRVATPAPSGDPTPSASSPSTSSSGTDPISTFIDFAGGNMQADVIGPPPDVAADASPNYNAEFLNGGLWIFNKDGSSGCSGTQTTTTLCVPTSDFWPQGSPARFPETPLSAFSTDGGIFGADTSLSTANQSVGGYSTSTNIECGQQGDYYNSCLWLGWDVLLPPQ